MSLRRVVVLSRQPLFQRIGQQIAQEIFTADTPGEALSILDSAGPELVLCDRQFLPAGNDRFLNELTNCTDAPLVVCDNPSLEEGGRTKMIDLLARLIGGNGKATSNTSPEVSNEQIGNKRADRDDRFFATDFAAAVALVGRSKAIVETLRLVKLVADSQCNPVLILGETGTGKELIARAVHHIRHRQEPFIAVNCAALTANLLESELFGHVKGSFTGADRDKTGLLEAAGNGTILLDEISEMPIELQAKLLRVLQEKSFRKVGGVKDIPCHATIIASSNRDLLKEVKAGRFRQDLLYRLNVSPIKVPALRSTERREDIRLLAEYFLKTSTICPQKHNKITGFTKLALEALEKHSWPGNIRELRNVIERAILLESTDKIGLNSIMLEQEESSEETLGAAFAKIKDFSLAKAERELIFRALQETGWQKSRAAALLGITRATLYSKVKQYNIQRTAPSTNSTDGVSTKTSGPAAATASAR